MCTLYSCSEHAHRCRGSLELSSSREQGPDSRRDSQQAYPGSMYVSTGGACLNGSQASAHTSSTITDNNSLPHPGDQIRFFSSLDLYEPLVALVIVFTSIHPRQSSQNFLPHPTCPPQQQRSPPS